MARNVFQGRSAKLLAIAISTIAISTTASASSKEKRPKAPEAVPGQFVVTLKAPSSTLGSRETEISLRGQIVDHIREDMILLQRPTVEAPQKVLQQLRDNPLVQTVDPNYIYKMIKTPNDPDFAKLWGMKNSGGLDVDGVRGLPGVDISAERAWEITTGSKNVVVAVIDTGVDFSHPDLAANAWVNAKEKNGTQGVDDDGNGYVDDINGYNAITNNGNSRDDNGHGSHCAGTIGARGDDGVGVVGVNWNVSIMAIKFLDASGGGTLANAVKAIDYARKSGAHILSNSWGGGGYTETLKNAIEATKEADQLFVAAAGNDSSDNDKFASYPASYQVDNIISVAASDNRGELAYFSNYGAGTVHLAAPGHNILSTVPGGYDSYSGTSMATPHVSGVAALVLADNPNQSYSVVKRRLLESARPLKTLTGKVQTGGVLDAYYALSGETPPVDPYDASKWGNRLNESVATPHPYPDKHTQTYTIKVPGAQRVSAHFLKFETEAGYDRVQFFNAAGESLGAWSGNNNDRFSPIADGDTLVLKFTSDDSVNGHGFDIDFVAHE